MPYLTQQRKDHLNSGGHIVTAGDLTYLLTTALLAKMPPAELSARLSELVSSFLPEDPRFGDFAVVLGSLDATWREWIRRTWQGQKDWGAAEEFDRFRRRFYERVVAPYEDTKIAQNGDVY